MTAPVLIKRYAGARLYDTVAGRYVSLEELRQWATRGKAFQVVDAATRDDVTRILLA